MSRIKGKTVVVALLFFTLAFVPLVITGNAEKEQVQTVTCYLIGNGDRVKKQNELSIQETENLLEKIGTAVEVFKPLKERDGAYLTDTEREEAKYVLDELFAALRDAGLIEAGVTPYTVGLFPDAGIALLHPILSCGVGCSYIPLYPGEAFLGVMLRPIFLQYFFAGYTGCFNVRLAPPRIEYWDWVGTQTIMVFGFVGIYIDFASVGLGIPPVQVLIGESLFTAGIDWWL
ncbi:MAG: hypothetical protein U9O96_02150 [Candidatus Thermoplasmatota archaeon]|nr:hypothetical protein [Candidatus Thermoplasmatota archaeon]